MVFCDKSTKKNYNYEKETILYKSRGRTVVPDRIKCVFLLLWLMYSGIVANLMIIYSIY